MTMVDKSPGKTIVLIRADSNNDNSNNFPLRIINYDASQTRFRVKYDGEVYFNNAVQTSDVRFKNNILDTNLGLNFINDLRPVSYFMNSVGEESSLDSIRRYGLIAQDVKSVYEKYTDSFAGWTLEDYSDLQSTQRLSYIEFIAPLIKAVQELSAKVDELESRLL